MFRLTYQNPQHRGWRLLKYINCFCLFCFYGNWVLSALAGHMRSRGAVSQGSGIVWNKRRCRKKDLHSGNGRDNNHYVHWQCCPCCWLTWYRSKIWPVNPQHCQNFPVTHFFWRGWLCSPCNGTSFWAEVCFSISYTMHHIVPLGVTLINGLDVSWVLCTRAPTKHMVAAGWLPQFCTNV